ncbi:MAG: site-specific DNA-methyltransferase [Pyrinomonadaceae bacterium]|jgi:adenine-specific DNA-methyltransferase|nr:site-specific DNA-methyltransferase [Pyrinomonadaceae bacterium]
MAVSISKNKINGIAEYVKQENIEFIPYFSNGENRLYYGDNLDVLQKLVVDVNVCGKVNLIYIDPPYSTGGIFQTRSQKDAYSDTLSGKDYLEFMQKRLVLLHKLLSKEGSFYIHLDSKMLFHIKLMLDDIFGSNKFQGMITRKKCKPKNYTRKTYGNISDYILFYTKSDNSIWNRPFDEWTDEKVLKEYPYIEEETGRRYKKVPIHAPGIRNGESGKEWRGMMPPQGKHWQFVPKALEEMEQRGEIYWSSNGNPRRKVYLENSKGIPVQDIWLDYLDINNQNTKGTGYPTEKNPELLRQIIKASSNEGDLVLDCFAGSGTTLAVADELKRKWIGIDCSDESINTIFDRFLNGISALGDFVEKKPSQKGLFDSTEILENSEIINQNSITNFTFFAECLIDKGIESKINSIKAKLKPFFLTESA